MLGTFIQQDSLFLMWKIKLQKSDKGNELLKYSYFNNGYCLNDGHLLGFTLPSVGFPTFRKNLASTTMELEAVPSSETSEETYYMV